MHKLAEAKPTIAKLENLYLTFVLTTLLVASAIVSAAIAQWCGTPPDQLTATDIAAAAYLPGLLFTLVCGNILYYASAAKQRIAMVALILFWGGVYLLPGYPLPPLPGTGLLAAGVDALLTPINALLPETLDLGLQYYLEKQPNMVLVVLLLMTWMLQRYLRLRRRVKALSFRAWQWLRIKPGWLQQCFTNTASPPQTGDD